MSPNHSCCDLLDSHGEGGNKNYSLLAISNIKSHYIQCQFNARAQVTPYGKLH